MREGVRILGAPDYTAMPLPASVARGLERIKRAIRDRGVFPKGAERPKPIDYRAYQENAGQTFYNNQMVALRMFELGLPLDHVKARDPSGVVAAAIEALAYDELVGEQDTTPFVPAVGIGNDWQADTAFYDKIRRVAGALNIPFDEMTDLGELAKQHQWTPEMMDAMVEAYVKE